MALDFGYDQSITIGRERVIHGVSGPSPVPSGHPLPRGEEWAIIVVRSLKSVGIRYDCFSKTN